MELEKNSLIPIDTSGNTRLLLRLNLVPRKPYIGFNGKGLSTGRLVAGGEFSFYKANKTCRNTHHGKQIISTH